MSGILQGLLASIAAKSSFFLYAWGRNQFGQVGTGDTTDQTSPVQISVSDDWAQAEGGRLNSLAVKTDGTLWS